MSIRERGRASFKRAIERFFSLLPVLPAMLVLFSLAALVMPEDAMNSVFSAPDGVDLLVGAAIGSLAFGQPLMGYLIGGEFYRGGLELSAATALILAWATVGLSFLPFEIRALGRVFALSRNLLALLFTLIIAIVTAKLVEIF